MPVTTQSENWSVLDGTLQDVIAREPAPLDSLARKRWAAVVVRNAYPRQVCHELVKRFYALGLLDDPNPSPSGPRRLNIGTALGWTKDDAALYFDAARAATELFSNLFAAGASPIDAMYRTLRALTPGVPVVVAREPDHREYGPAIVRAYRAGVGHVPHYDKFVDSSNHAFVVSRIREQLAVILCLQNSGNSAHPASQPILYSATGGPDWDSCLAQGAFAEIAQRMGLQPIHIQLEPGDLYVFRSSTIHEVPPVRGDRARIVLAAFLGRSEMGDEILVWS